jgi:hypothetical protein
MNGAKANRVRAKRAAEELLTSWGDVTLPVDVEAIAAKLKISVDVMELPSEIFGATAHDGIRARILVSTRCETAGNRRFTIAHELGHCCIDGHAEVLFATSEIHYSAATMHSHSERAPVEIEANCFAAALLLPATSAREFASRFSPSVELIVALSERAEVSRMMAAIRATELVDDPFAVILSPT